MARRNRDKKGCRGRRIKINERKKQTNKMDGMWIYNERAIKVEKHEIRNSRKNHNSWTASVV
jgi:hypothetical protein